MKASVLRRHGSLEPRGRGVVLSALHPAHRSGRSIFGSRVFDPDELGRVLKDGHQSRKIGKVVQKGRLRGAPIFTLTLEERATCPRSCAAWAVCYGNNMQAAERVMHGAALEESLWCELADLQAAHPRGFLVRLHVLGDFYSTGYVRLWQRALAAFPALTVFGYTAHPPASEIGQLILAIGASPASRWHVRFSGLDAPRGGAVMIEPGATTEHILCPAQTGASDCCATCALCWHSDRTVAFRRH